MKTYTAYLRPWALGWEIDIPNVGVTQTDDPADAEETARDYIASDLDLAEDRFEVRVVPESEEPKRTVTLGAGDAPAITIPADLDLSSLESWKRHIWLTPDLTVHERRAMINAVERERMGDLLRDVS